MFSRNRDCITQSEVFNQLNSTLSHEAGEIQTFHTLISDAI